MPDLRLSSANNTRYSVVFVISSPEHEVLRVSYCDDSPSVRSWSVRSHFLVYTLASTNINQSAPNLVRVFMTIRSRMSSIMDVIELEHQELFALDLKKIAIFHFFYTLASTNINQSAPDLIKIYVTIRSPMSSILGLIRPERSELFALELRRIAIFHFVYTLASTNINQLALNLVQIYITIRSWMSSILGLIRPQPLESFALELKKLLYFTLFTL